jgi:hypothetical protein
MALREQSLLLLKARRWEDQRVAGRMADELEKIETAEQSRQMLLEYETRVRNMKDRHIQEMNAVLIANESRLLVLEKVEKKDISAAQKRIANLQAEMKISHEAKDRGNKVVLPDVRSRSRTASEFANKQEIHLLKLPPLFRKDLRKRAKAVRSSVPGRRTVRK